ncbi:inositol monophosphatase family protein [Staphylococcus massiliensis]|uniref:inositol monophosphatase family protein n=1 Tax=Staphylococcus massiliensis TaxID=555791 RepID=UPI001EDDFADD|nr:inositol monophosphatase family protein [Staphylococcus massiliensis]MCG3399255.1 inositol monophosphatase family protein [Staphylococcus massiliensis]
MANRNLLEIDGIMSQWILELPDFVAKKMETFEVGTKLSPTDLVTSLDEDIQRDFEALIDEHFPDHQIVGEEKDNSGIDMNQGYVWIIDPIDGTTNLVKQQDDYCLVLSLFIDGKPSLAYHYDFVNQKFYKAVDGEVPTVNGTEIKTPLLPSLADSLISFDPEPAGGLLTEKLIQASFGFRYEGAGGIGAMKIINGQIGASIDFYANVWDMSTQLLYAEQLGLVISDLKGNPIDLNHVKGAVFAHPDVFDDVIKLINE